MPDLSRLNKFIIPVWFDVYMLAEIFQMVYGSKFFSTLDLMKAYHHIPLVPESRPLGLKDSGACSRMQFMRPSRIAPGL